MLSLIPKLNTPSLVIVHTAELLEQTCDRVRSWLGIEPGVISGGKLDLKPVTVAMVQTLARRDLADEAISQYFGAVLVDECHHSPATTWAEILGQMPARFKYGFTATAWRKDRLQFLMWRLIGNKTATIARDQVEAVGRIVRPEVVTVHTDFFYELADSSQWGEMIGDLSKDEARNDLIATEVRRRVTHRRRALVLTDRIEHAARLAGMLNDLRPVLLTGDVSKGDRTIGMEAVKAGARLTIATIHLLGEGVDVPGWDLLFLASPIAGGPRTLQAIGRVARPAPGKARAEVVDFVDSQVPSLVSAWKQRHRLYAA